MELAQEVVRVLEAIDQGLETVQPVGETWHEVNAGNVTFKSSSGWTFVIFIDSGEWDYIDTAMAPDGRVLDFDEMWAKHKQLVDYVPKNLAAWGAAPAA